MSELSPRARALLAAAHSSDDPLATDAARVRRSVLLRIGSAGVGATAFSLSLERARAFVALAAPKLVTVVLVAVGGSALYQQQQRSALAPAASAASAARPRLARPAVPAPVLAEPAALLTAEAPVVPVALVQRPLRRAPARPVTAVPPVEASQLEAEMRWVRAADAALRAGNASAAQGLLEQHLREFPNGALAEEREGLRIVAGCQGGESAEGKRAAARFLERAPRSLLAGRVRAACPQLVSPK